MSYYHNIAQPLTKEDFDEAIKAIENSDKVIRLQPPIVMSPEMMDEYKQAQTKGSYTKAGIKKQAVIGSNEGKFNVNTGK